MNNAWLNEIDIKIYQFLNSLRNDSSEYRYSPALEGVTEAGKNLSLGFSCFAIKIFFTLNLWNTFTKLEQDSWLEFINSHQESKKNLPKNSFIDRGLHQYYQQVNIRRSLKELTKKTLNVFPKYNLISFNQQYVNSIKAESKQAIATLYQVNSKNNLPYLDFPKNDHEIVSYLNKLDWSKPWSAGAQFSSLCVFTATQIDKTYENKISESLYSYLDNIIDDQTGLYFSGKRPSNTEAINGTMKIITGLDWLNMPIHHPKKIIDFCLSVTPSNYGCDLVDIVYVLYKSFKTSKYKQKEIVEYLCNLLVIIEKHYFPEIGGFSYSINKSQTGYYGVNITNGMNTPDIHGTILLTWALSMIFEITENEKHQWSILKP